MTTATERLSCLSPGNIQIQLAHRAPIARAGCLTPANLRPLRLRAGNERI